MVDDNIPICTSGNYRDSMSCTANLFIWVNWDTFCLSLLYKYKVFLVITELVVVVVIVLTIL